MISRPSLLRHGLDPCRSTPHATRLSRYSTRLEQNKPRRLFSSTHYRPDENKKNYYEILNISPTASAAELKKQFYSLSKETHPDRHPDDPTAGERFSQVSEAYSVIGNPEKRKRYDRDVMRTQAAHSSPRRQGSYFGSRPATGLSKRRGVFRGPPPSYYTHGNPSASNARQAQSSAAGPSAGGTFNAGAYATEDGSAFDPNPVYRTQTVEDVRRRDRKARAMAEAASAYEQEGNIWGRFALVSGIMLFGVTIGGVLFSVGDWTRGAAGGMVKGDGSRRERKAG